MRRWPAAIIYGSFCAVLYCIIVSAFRNPAGQGCSYSDCEALVTSILEQSCRFVRVVFTNCANSKVHTNNFVGRR